MNGRRLSPVARTVLIIICLIAFLILLENFLNMASRVRKETIVRKEKEQIQKEYEKTEEFQQEVYIEKSIEETMKILESKDYETLFEHLDSKYKQCTGINNVEALKKYILENYGEPAMMELLDFYKTDERLICDVRIELYGERVIKPLVVIPGEDDTFTLMFDKINIIHEYPASSWVSNNRLKYSLKYRMDRDSDYTCVFEMTNKTSNTITGSLEKTNVYTTNSRIYVATNGEELKNITLAPNETKTLMYKIDISDGKYLQELETRFVFVESNGQETTLSVLRPEIYY